MMLKRKPLPLAIELPKECSILKEVQNKMHDLPKIPETLYLSDQLFATSRRAYGSPLYHASYKDSPVVAKLTKMDHSGAPIFNKCTEMYKIFAQLNGLQHVLLPSLVCYECSGSSCNFIEVYPIMEKFRFSPDPISDIMTLNEALLEMHGRDVAHLDFKIENILMSPEMPGRRKRILLADLGESRLCFGEELGEISTTRSVFETNPFIRAAIQELDRCDFGYNSFIDCILQSTLRDKYKFIDQIMFGAFLMQHFYSGHFLHRSGKSLILYGILSLSPKCIQTESIPDIESLLTIGCFRQPRRLRRLTDRLSSPLNCLNLKGIINMKDELPTIKSLTDLREYLCYYLMRKIAASLERVRNYSQISSYAFFISSNMPNKVLRTENLKILAKTADTLEPKQRKELKEFFRKMPLEQLENLKRESDTAQRAWDEQYGLIPLPSMC